LGWGDLAVHVVRLVELGGEARGNIGRRLDIYFFDRRLLTRKTPDVDASR
jgi:hypothetical protein